MWTFHTHKITRCVSLCVRFLSPRIVRAAAGICIPFLPWLNNVPLHGETTFALFWHEWMDFRSFSLWAVVKRLPGVGCVCVSLMTSNAEQLFMAFRENWCSLTSSLHLPEPQDSYPYIGIIAASFRVMMKVSEGMHMTQAPTNPSCPCRFSAQFRILFLPL